MQRPFRTQHTYNVFCDGVTDEIFFIDGFALFDAGVSNSRVVRTEYNRTQLRYDEPGPKHYVVLGS